VSDFDGSADPPGGVTPAAMVTEPVAESPGTIGAGIVAPPTPVAETPAPPAAQEPPRSAAPAPPVRSARPAGAAPSGVQPSCGCQSGGAQPPGGCGGCPMAGMSYVFALGTVGFDFGTEARRDTFRQLMPDYARSGDDGAPVLVSPNPYDVFQLSDYLDQRPSESTKLIWTLNLDLTPIYAIEAEPAYPEDVYGPLREALRAEALSLEDDRVSLPGVLTNRTVQLFSGQVVPVVVAQPRGLYAWNETQLVNGVIRALSGTIDVDEGYVRLMIRSFLDKVYFECRNLGQAPQDRALNFAATNAYQFGAGIADGFLSGRNLVPGASDELYTLDSIEVSKSPYCRMDSDCWDVRVTFFDPVNDRRARSVYMFTIDVSDALPVTLSPYHRYLTT